MKFLSAIIVAFTMSTQALAGLPPTSVKGQLGTKSTTFDFQVPYNQYTKTAGTAALLETGSYQLLKNPAFEATTYSSNWTASGGTLAAAATTNIFFSKGATWDSSSAAQTLTSDAISVPEGFKGGDCEASMHIKVPSGTATHLLQAWDGTNILVSATVTNSTFFARNTVNFPCPQSGTVALRLVSVAADEPLIAIDDAYLGLARNVGSTQLISETTSWSPNAVALSSGSITNQTSTGKYVRIGDRAKIMTMTQFSNTSAAFSGFRMSLPPGCAIDTAKVANDPSFSVSLGYATLLDSGVSHYAISGKVSLISGDSQNVAVTWATTNYAQIAISSTAPFTFAGNDTVSTDFEVPCVGWTAQTTASIDAISKRGSISFSTGSATITGALATFNVAGFGTNTLEGQALAPTTANDLGIRMTGAPAGVYEVTAVGKFYASSPATTGTRTVCEFRLYDGTNHSAGAYGIAAGAGTYETNDSIANITGLFTLSSAGTINVVVRGQRVAGNGTCYAEAGAYISIKNVSQNSPAIILANSVSTTVTNGVKVLTAKVQALNGATCTVSEEDGDWLGATTPIAAGRCTVAINAGTFSATPKCSLTGHSPTYTGVTQSLTAHFTSLSTSTMTFETRYDTGGANAIGGDDSSMMLMCVGAR